MQATYSVQGRLNEVEKDYGMTYYVVSMRHPDGDGWGQHVAAHVSYLESLIVAGTLMASGPIKGDCLRGDLLIFHVADQDEVRRLIEHDPFSKAGLIATINVTEWDPIFGVFRAEAGAATISPNKADLRQPIAADPTVAHYSSISRI